MNKKKVLVLGVGAQGSAAARKLDREPDVSEIVCADIDRTAVDSLVSELTKATGATVDAHSKDSIVEAARGVDLILNGLPLECTKNVLDAALEVKANYQDYAATTSLDEDWVESIRIQYDVYGPRFKEIGRLAIVGTGSAPGLICAATRDAMRYLDTCDTIYNIVWEGVEAKRFLPFWWSPVTALHDMSEKGYAFENGRLIRLEAFEHPVWRQYEEADHELVFVEHCHDEPIHYSFNAEKFFKGAKNAYFKYAGAGVDFAKPLYRAGLLSHEKEIINGVEIAPFDVVLKHIPPAPKYLSLIHISEPTRLDGSEMCIRDSHRRDVPHRPGRIPVLKTFHQRQVRPDRSHIVGYADHGSGGYILRICKGAGHHPQHRDQGAVEPVCATPPSVTAPLAAKWIQSPFF